MHKKVEKKRKVEGKEETKNLTAQEATSTIQESNVKKKAS